MRPPALPGRISGLWIDLVLVLKQRIHAIQMAGDPIMQVRLVPAQKKEHPKNVIFIVRIQQVVQ